MANFKNPIIIIPARMGSSRLPGKPLADLNGQAMVIHVMRRAEQSGVGPVYIAAAEQEIVDAVIVAGGNAILTDPDLPSGSDRVFRALEIVDPEGKYDVVINLQGDLPTISPEIIERVLDPLTEDEVDIGTLAAVIEDKSETEDPNVVKAIVGLQHGQRVGRALFFSRAAVPFGEGPYYHHIGLYAFRRDALRRFVSLPEGVLERRERLEQLRALEVGMRIDVALVDTVPDGVDTPSDLARARERLTAQS
ncbi:MAG: 3-deoxy-manno-octulosonate cytidylyltransferase [Rhodospirillaceae bacterium]